MKKRKKAKLGQGSVAKAVEGSAEAEEGGAEGGEKSWGMRVNGGWFLFWVRWGRGGKVFLV